MHVYIDGEYFNKEDAKVSVFDHGLLYGDGIFEGIRFYDGRVFKLKEHIQRLLEKHEITIRIVVASHKQQTNQTLHSTTAKLRSLLHLVATPAP